MYLQIYFWAEELATAVYIRSHVTYNGIISSLTPHKRWFGSSSSLIHLNIFGTQWWYVLRHQNPTKLDPRAREAILLEYNSNYKG